MEVILTKDVENLGKVGQTITVKDGYARNFLIPQRFALPATGGARAQLESQRAAQTKTAHALKTKALELADRLNKTSCVIPMPVGDQEKLHGAVTAGDITQVLLQQGIKLDKHQVLLETPMTRLGVMEIPIKLHPEVTVHLKVSVVPQ